MPLTRVYTYAIDKNLHICHRQECTHMPLTRVYTYAIDKIDHQRPKRINKETDNKATDLELPTSKTHQQGRGNRHGRGNGQGRTNQHTSEAAHSHYSTLLVCTSHHSTLFVCSTLCCRRQLWYQYHQACCCEIKQHAHVYIRRHLHYNHPHTCAQCSCSPHPAPHSAPHPLDYQVRAEKSRKLPFVHQKSRKESFGKHKRMLWQSETNVLASRKKCFGNQYFLERGYIWGRGKYMVCTELSISSFSVHCRTGFEGDMRCIEKSIKPTRHKTWLKGSISLP